MSCRGGLEDVTGQGRSLVGGSEQGTVLEGSEGGTVAGGVSIDGGTAQLYTGASMRW